jgi:hypothetical protein
VTWRVAGVVVAVAAAMALRWSSVLSSGIRTSREHSAQLRLSLSARPERVERCRELSDEELARLPAHMRLRTQCEGYSARYRLAITVDGRQLAAVTLRGGGLRRDRPLHVFQEHDVAPGRQRVTVEIVRVEQSTAAAQDTTTTGAVVTDTLLGGRAERERAERSRRVAEAMPARLALDTTITLVPGGVALITFDRNTRRLTILGGA